MLKLLALDRFTLLLFVMVLLASFFPVSGQAASVFGVLTTVAIMTEIGRASCRERV